MLVREYERLLRALSLTQRRLPFELEAFVVLPDHLHTIWVLPEGDSDYSRRWMVLKRIFSTGLAATPHSSSQEIKREKGIWQRRFWEHALRDPADHRRHLDFIHYDPVRHGLCPSPRDWPYGSFLQLADRGVYPLDWPGASSPDLAGVHAE